MVFGKFNLSLKGTQEAERALTAQQMIANGTIKERAMSMTGASAGVMKYMASLNVASISEMTFAQKVRASAIALKEQALAWGMSPMGIATIAVTAISLLISRISTYSQKLEENRQKAKEAASEANTLGDEIASLSSKYIALSEAVKTDASAKEDLISTQAELLKKLGLEGESVDDLIAKYGSLANAINQASIETLKESEVDLIAGVSAAEDELLDVGADGFWGGNNIINATGDDAVKAFKELEKSGLVSSGSYGSGGGSLVLIGDDTTTEGILENYQKLEDAINALRDSDQFTEEELTNNSLYQAIYARYHEMKEKVDAYKTSIGDLNENLAQQFMLTALQGRELPKSEQEFEKFKQELIDTAVASGKFIGSNKEIEDSINNYLSKVPEFAKYFKITSGNINGTTDSLEELNKAIDNIQSAYNTVKSAIEEYNKYGYLSVDTVQSLLELDDEYLASLIDENGQLVLNTASYEDLAIAKLENLKASAVNELNAWISTLEDEGLTADELTAKYQGLADSRDAANGEPKTGYTDKLGNKTD